MVPLRTQDVGQDLRAALDLLLGPPLPLPPPDFRGAEGDFTVPSRWGHAPPQGSSRRKGPVDSNGRSEVTVTVMLPSFLLLRPE